MTTKVLWDENDYENDYVLLRTTVIMLLLYYTTPPLFWLTELKVRELKWEEADHSQEKNGEKIQLSIFAKVILRIFTHDQIMSFKRKKK